MTIEQTITIPADRRIVLDLPFEAPVGKTKITVTLEAETPTASAYEAILNLRGIAKKMGSSLTTKDFLKMRREDLYLEEGDVEI